MAAQGRHHGALVIVDPAQVIAHAADIIAGELARQRLQPIIQCGIGRHDMAEILVEDLRGPGFEIVSLQAVQIEWFHP